jgi:lipopolysaccharide biosynthesis glycosyltransferase
MNFSETIHIVFAIDERYVQHCAVTITSIFENSAADKISISILYNDISNELKEKLEQYIHIFTSNVQFILTSNESLRKFPVSKHITLATYYRLLLPELLDKKIKKVLFLDCDLIIKKDIRLLWNVDISEYSHAAVLENGMDSTHKKLIGIAEYASYFNAGVMLINLEYWRSYNLLERAEQYIKNNSRYIKYWDQDILNFIFQSQWLEIHPIWNSTEIVFMSYEWKNRKFDNLKCTELTKAREEPAIIHFTGSNKPWHYYNNHPCKQEYYKYLDKTPWRNFKPIKTPFLIIKEFSKKHLNSMRKFMTLLKY